MLVQWLSVLSVVGVTLASVLTPPQVTQDMECEPGAVWVPEEGCGACFCLQNGKAACSKMACHGDDDRMPTMPEKMFQETILRPLLGPPEPVVYRNNTNCTDGEQWMDECNMCGCMGDSVAICTRMSCDTPDAGRQNKPDMKMMTMSKDLADGVMERCKAGDTWSDDCSKCTCASEDQLICSYSCEQLPTRRRRRRQAECTPGQEWQDGCNNCFCLDSGLKACTKRACLTQQPQLSFPSGDTACNQEACPADCGQTRDSRGCITCTCGPNPFFSGSGGGNNNGGRFYWL